MKLLKITELNQDGRHILEGIIEGRFLRGGFSFKKPGQRTHGEGRHTHDDHEVFIFIEGKAVVEVDEKEYPVSAGDVFIAEPGEDHHIRADDESPCANLWLHGSDAPAYLEE